MITKEGSIEEAIHLLGYDINEIELYLVPSTRETNDLVGFIVKVMNVIWDKNEWSFVLRISDTNEIINIKDIIENSQMFPTKGDTIMIGDKKYKIRYSTYFSDEQIVEWIACELNNTLL